MREEVVPSHTRTKLLAQIDPAGMFQQPHPGVLQQHVDDALFLAGQRNSALHSAHLKLPQMLRLEERLMANVDGVRVAGDTGSTMLLRQADLSSPESVFAAVAAALVRRDERGFLSLLNSATVQPLQEAFVRAMTFVGPVYALPALQRLLRRDDSTARQIALIVHGQLGIDPGEPLIDAIFSRDFPLQIAAFRSAAALGRVEVARYIVPHVSASDASLGVQAALACARLGIHDRDVLQKLRSVALQDVPLSSTALTLAVCCMSAHEANRWIDALEADTRTRRLAVTAMGVLGDPDRIPYLIGLLGDPAQARHAGAAVGTITGLNLNDAAWSQPQPDGFAAGPTEDPSDPDVSSDPDEGLPWPSTAGIAAWWQEHGPAFMPGVRYLLGQPVTRASLQQVLEAGTQAQRHAAASQLGLLDPAQPLFPIYAGAAHQRTLLSSRVEAR